MQGCKDLTVVLDCPILQRTSRLQHFIVKDCDKLAFISLSSNSLLQIPPELTIDNVKEIVALPSGFIKTPKGNTERKCTGNSVLKALHVKNSKITTIAEKAIENVTGMRMIEFHNVSITQIESHAINAQMGYENTIFIINNCKIDNMDTKAFTIQSKTTTISSNTFNNLNFNTINITSDVLQIQDNAMKTVKAHAFTTKSSMTDITGNDINLLQTNALANMRCAKKRCNKRHFNVISNTIKNIEPHSLLFDYTTCKSSTSPISFSSNKIDCHCQNIAFLYNTPSNGSNDLKNMILNVKNNNTCISAPCILPVEIVKTLMDNDMCGVDPNLQVKCLLYNDRSTSPIVEGKDEEATEQAPTFYLIRQANTEGASAAMTAIDKNNIFLDSHLNMTNRTTIQVEFDSSKDFVENLRNTNASHKTPSQLNLTIHENTHNRCSGSQCKNAVAYDRQKALDFYKYVYAQLRPPRDSKNNKK